MVNMGMRPSKSDGYGYSNPGRGYRYYPGPVIYPFGYGLQYTEFSCSALTFSNDTNTISTSVSNNGNIDSGAIVLVYFIPSSPGGANPLKRLIGYSNIDMIRSQETESIKMNVYPEFDTSSPGKYVLDGVCA